MKKFNSFEYLVQVIAKYHIDLGARMVADNGKNQKVSPSRELANAITSADYIHRSQAVDYCDSCVDCYGEGWSDCKNCKGRGLVLKQD